MTSNKLLTLIISLLVIILFALSLFATISHYMPPPSLDQVIAHSIPPGPEWFGTQMSLYQKHSLLTFLHVGPAFLLTILVPLLLNNKLRAKYPSVHRWSGRLFIFFSTILIGSGIIISLVFPFGGIGETIVTLCISSYFGYCLVRGYLMIRSREIHQHKKWMIRALAAGFAPATMRIFFSGILITTDVSPQDIFATTLWIGFAINLLIAECWIDLKSPKKISRKVNV